MVMISSISIDNLVKKTAEIKLASDKNSYDRITVDLTEEETAEVIQLVSEIIATRLRMPAIKAKLEERKASFDELLPKAYETPGDNTVDARPPEPDFKFCDIHGTYVGDDCPVCAENADQLSERSRGMKPSDNIDPPF